MLTQYGAYREAAMHSLSLGTFRGAERLRRTIGGTSNASAYSYPGTTAHAIARTGTWPTQAGNCLSRPIGERAGVPWFRGIFGAGRGVPRIDFRSVYGNCAASALRLHKRRERHGVYLGSGKSDHYRCPHAAAGSRDAVSRWSSLAARDSCCSVLFWCLLVAGERRRQHQHPCLPRLRQPHRLRLCLRRSPGPKGCSSMSSMNRRSPAKATRSTSRSARPFHRSRSSVHR